MRGILQSAATARRLAACAAAAVAGAIAVTGILATAQPAAAQQGFGNFFGYQTKKHPKRRAVRRRRSPSSQQKPAEATKEVKQETKPSGPVYIVVSIGDQQISVYDRTGRIARSPISTGVRGLDTPKGVFSVIGKERYHRSNLYGGAPMPWMQRITWSGVAMHAGHVTGRPASHGCIRLPYSFAPKLWKMTKMGARVVVARKDTVPFEISHSFLPLPTMQPSPLAADSERAALAPESRIELASMSTPSSVATTMAAVPDSAAGEPGKPSLLNPMAYAAALKERAKTDKAAADKAAKEALEAAQAAGAEARRAVEDIEKAKADLEAAEANLAVLESAPSAPKDAESPDAGAAAAAKAAMETAKIAARSEFIRARAALEEATAREAVKTPAAFAAVQAWKIATAASVAAKQTLEEAARREEPVSVFISKKEGRVFIRQDWKEVYEAPVTIRDPDRPLGTHVYIAVAAEPDGSAMRWSAISVPPETPRSKGRRHERSKDALELPIPKTGTSGPVTAAGALDRIELAPETRQRISELLWTGASLIVSDHGRSYEMGEYTDFIVLTR